MKNASNNNIRMAKRKMIGKSIFRTTMLLIIFVFAFAFLFSSKLGFLSLNNIANAETTSDTTSTITSSDPFDTDIVLNNTATSNWSTPTTTGSVRTTRDGATKTNYFYEKVAISNGNYIRGSTDAEYYSASSSKDHVSLQNFATASQNMVGIHACGDCDEHSCTVTMTHSIVVPNTVTAFDLSFSMFTGGYCSIDAWLDKRTKTKITATLKIGSTTYGNSVSCTTDFKDDGDSHTNTAKYDQTITNNGNNTYTLQLYFEFSKSDVSGYEFTDQIAVVGPATIKLKSSPSVSVGTTTTFSSSAEYMTPYDENDSFNVLSSTNWNPTWSSYTSCNNSDSNPYSNGGTLSGWYSYHMRTVSYNANTTIKGPTSSPNDSYLYDFGKLSYATIGIFGYCPTGQGYLHYAYSDTTIKVPSIINRFRLTCNIFAGSYSVKTGGLGSETGTHWTKTKVELYVTGLSGNQISETGNYNEIYKTNSWSNVAKGDKDIDSGYINITNAQVSNGYKTLTLRLKMEASKECNWKRSAESNHMSLIGNIKVYLGGPYHVEYNGNDNDGGTMNTQTIQCPSATPLTAPCPFTKYGYYFVGWSETQDGDVKYDDGYTTSATDSTSHITLKQDKTVTLYAVWKPFTFSFNGTVQSPYLSGSLQVITGKTSSYISFTEPDGASYHTGGHTFTQQGVAYEDANHNSLAQQPRNIGANDEYQNYYLVLTVQNDNTSETWTQTIPFSIVKGDFNHIASPPSGTIWGTVNNPYVIHTALQLSNLARIVEGTQTPLDSITDNAYPDGCGIATDRTYENAYFIIDADITVNNNFISIGYDVYDADSNTYTLHSFRGTIDGQNHTITFSSYSDTSARYCGLFGYVEGATIKNITVTGSIAGGDNTGGIVGYAGKNGNTNTTIINCQNGANITGGSQVGGIVGYADGVTLETTACSNVANKTVTGSGNNIGGFFGKIKDTTISVNLTNNSNVVATIEQTNESSQYVGGIVGFIDTNSSLGSSGRTYTNNGQISGYSYVGGLFGAIPKYSSNDITLGGVTIINTGTVIGQGEYVGGIAGENRRAFSGSVKSATSVYGNSTNNDNATTASYVGGFFGACFVTSDDFVFSTTSSLSNIGTDKLLYVASSGMPSHVTGSSYVGGLVGASYGVKYAINTTQLGIATTVVSKSTSTSNLGFCGGLFGYVAGRGANNLFNFVKFTPGTYTGTLTFDGYGSYVGRLAGYVTGISIENTATGASDVVLTNSSSTTINSTNGICIGGIVGYLASCAIHEEVIAPMSSLNMFFEYSTPVVDGQGNSVVTEDNYETVLLEPGKIYPYIIHYTYENEEYSTLVYVSTTFYGKIDTPAEVNISNLTVSSFVIKEENPFVSSVTANSYLNTFITGRYGNGIDINGNIYVGGIIGKIDSGVGDNTSGGVGTNNSVYRIGNSSTQNLYLENTGDIDGSLYVGGLIGAAINNTASSGTSTNVYKTNIYAYMTNTGDIGNASASFVGGLIGSNGNSYSINPNTSYTMVGIDGASTLNVSNGCFNGSTSETTTISGYDFVGGAVGFMNVNSANYIHKFINVATIDAGTEGSYVGGLVGYMGAGLPAGASGYSINNCISTPYTTVSGNTDYYIGGSYIGGLVGLAGDVSINNSFTYGFYYSRVNSNSGGICGGSIPTTAITSSWALLYVNGLTSTYSYSNSNGNYIMVQAQADTIWKIPSFDELKYEAGLLGNGSYTGTKYSTSTAFSHANTQSKVGYISLKLKIPGVGGATNEDYIAFFNGNGRREASSNLYTNYDRSLGSYSGYVYWDSENSNSERDYLYLNVYLAQAKSFSVCYETAKFVNVENTKKTEFDALDNDTKIKCWEDGFVNGRFSDQYIYVNNSATTYNSNTHTYDLTYSPIASGSGDATTFSIMGNIYYKNLETGYAVDSWMVGCINTSYASGSEVMPIMISDDEGWVSFCDDIKASTTGLKKYYKLKNDIDLTKKYTNNSRILAGGVVNNSARYFAGTLDGNGKTITYEYTVGTGDIGLFPDIATGATIKNLKLDGTLTSSGNNVGALIGNASNSCTIEYVRSDVAVSGGKNVGGLIGRVNATKITITDVALTGSVTAASTNTSSYGNYGTGGIIGIVEASKTVEIDSARNAGEVKGECNTGGIVGYVGGVATLTNSCNTGTVEEQTHVKSRLSYVGGICGKVTAAGSVNVYACYNSGKVHGKCARVGGLLGCDTDNYANSSGRTEIYYSFNSGEVYSGDFTNREEVNGEGQTMKTWSGGECGGLIGMAISVDMYYCYNIGTVTSFGVAAHLKENQSRTGGLVGLMYRYQDKYYCNMEYCYNAGFVRNRCTVKNVIYMSGLVGCCIWERNGAWTLDVLKFWAGATNMKGTVAHNYSMHGQVDLGKKDGTTDTLNMTKGSTYVNEDGYAGVDHHFEFLETGNYRTNGWLYIDYIYWADNWTLQDKLVDATKMICRYDDSKQCGKIPEGFETGEGYEWSTEGGTYGSTELLRTGDIKGHSKFGYIYIPGCLPQLSIFATDTESGVAMTGSTTGFNTETQTYELKSAGSEYSPYVIQNGIDLLGLSTLVAIGDGYDGDNIYFAYANKFNNLDGKHLDNGLDMNTLNLTGMTYESFKSYKVNNKTQTIALVWDISVPGSLTAITPTQSFYHATGGYGKNILLLRIANNNYLNGVSSTGQNFYQLGGSSNRPFRGTLDGYRKTVNDEIKYYPVISNLKIKRTTANETGGSDIYAAFVGYGEDCAIRNFTLGKINNSDSVSIEVNGNFSTAIASAFVAKAVGKVTMSGLVADAGVDIKVSNSSSTAYAGGICGYAYPNTDSNGTKNILIEECSSSADITIETTSTTNYAGGILGYMNEISTKTGTGVSIKNSSVYGGNIKNKSNNTTNIGTGGIVGGRSTIGPLTISGCEVGNKTNNVYIYGNNSVGGIISYTNGADATAKTIIQDCTVGTKAYLSKWIYNANDHTTYKTAFGGFMGYSKECQIIGTNTFNGTIYVGTSSDKYAGENIGGLIGYLGPNTVVKNNVRIAGKIDAGNTVQAKNIGGAIGYAPNDRHNIDGTYYINPQMITGNSQYVGGFIGKNDGVIYLLGSSSIIDLSSGSGTGTSNSESQSADDDAEPQTTPTINSITANKYVGGFIGYNSSTGTIKIGSQTEANDTTPSVGTFTATLVANVNGQESVGGFVGYNAGTITTAGCKANVVNKGNICNAPEYYNVTKIGGIVGYNITNANFKIEEQENYFANAGTIGYDFSQSQQTNQIEYAGGIVGYNEGNFVNIGTLANTGAIYGKEHIAGSIGYFASGKLYGTMINGIAQTSEYDDIVSRTTKENNAYVTRFEASTTSLTNPTSILLEESITEGLNYYYTIGKTNYYFNAPITGKVVTFENEKVTVLGKQTVQTTDWINQNIEIKEHTTVISSTQTLYYYFGTNGITKYHYQSSSTTYGIVESLNENTITIYPTLEATSFNGSDVEDYSAISNNTISNGSKPYYYKVGSTYYGFDGHDLSGTIAYKVNSAVAFSDVTITASREPLTGTQTAYVGLRIAKGNNYKFYAGTTPYFFTAKFAGLITEMIGEQLTISSYNEYSYAELKNTDVYTTYVNPDIKAGRKYIFDNNGGYYFTAAVDGEIVSLNETISNSPAVSINTTITTSTSALDALTKLNIGAHVEKDAKYTFHSGTQDYYFTADYTGDITFLGIETDSQNVKHVKYGITNTDYRDMTAFESETETYYGFVSGKTNIGGVVSIVNEATEVGIYTEGTGANEHFVDGVYTKLINFGKVQSTDGTNVGGSIGSMAGKITGRTINNVTQYVEFYNYGTVNVVENGGGCIGIYSGSGNLVQMFNYQNTGIYDPDGCTIEHYNNIGGCIGLVQAPSAGHYAKLTNSIVVNSGLVMAHTTRTNVNISGDGFGGVIGTIADGAVDNKNNWSVNLYSDGSVYCGEKPDGQGGKIANKGKFSNVGGLIGRIGNAPIILQSVLNYTKRSEYTQGDTSTVTAVSGWNNVGGIIGFNNSSVAGSGNTGENASVRYCYNVGGEVWGNYSDGSIGGIIGKVGSNNPVTYCCYWVSAFKNSSLQAAKVNDLGSTLTKTWTTAFSAENDENGAYAPSNWENFFKVLKYYLGTAGVTSGYFTVGSNNYYKELYTYPVQIFDEAGDPVLTELGNPTYNYYDFYDIFFGSDTNITKYRGEWTDAAGATQEGAIVYFNTLPIATTSFVWADRLTETDIPVVSILTDKNSSDPTTSARGTLEYINLKTVVSTYMYSSAEFIYNDAGDLGYYTAGAQSYSTGRDETGYFFAYANDVDPEHPNVKPDYSDTGILTEHTRKDTTTEADFDLNMWKSISHAYGYDDTNTATSALIYNTSLNTTDNASFADRSGATATEYHIYAKAYMPTKTKVVNNVSVTEPTGYYLYAQAQVDSGLTVSYNGFATDEAFYIAADSKTCKNVLIFYKQVSVTTKLTYNGLERTAPISGVTATASKTSKASYYTLNDHATASGGRAYNVGTDKGEYLLDATILYVPDNAFKFTTAGGNTGETEIDISSLTEAQKTLLYPGKSYKYNIGTVGSPVWYSFTIPSTFVFPNATNKVGDLAINGFGWLNALPPTLTHSIIEVVSPVIVGKAVSDTTLQTPTYMWKIVERKITIKAENKTKTTGSSAIYYGDHTSETITLTVSNVVGLDGPDTSTLPKTMASNVYPGSGNTLLPMYFHIIAKKGNDDITTWSCKISSDSNFTSSKGYSAKDGGYCKDGVTYKVIKYEYTLTAVDAGTYTLKAEKDNSAARKDNYSIPTATSTLKINRRVLTVDFSDGGSVEYDGNPHKLTLKVSNWGVGETKATVEGYINNASFSIGGLSKGSISTSNLGSGNVTTASSVVSLEYTAIDKGSYQVTWSSDIEFGTNYVLKAKTNGLELTITPLVLKYSITQRFSNSDTVQYDGENHTYQITVTTETPGKEVGGTTISDIVSALNSAASMENATGYSTSVVSGPTATSGSSTTVQITVKFVAKNVGKYKMKVAALSPQDANFGMSAPNNLTAQEITARPLTISSTGTTGNHTYNQAIQGITSIEIGNFVAGEAALSMISKTNNNCSFSAPTPSSTATKITYSGKTVNAGTYSLRFVLGSSATNYSLSTTTYSWVINALTITCDWTENAEYVYTGEDRTISVTSITIKNGNTTVVGPISPNPSDLTKFNVNITGSYVDTLTVVTVPEEEATKNVGTYHSNASYTNCYGTNAAGTGSSTYGNYQLISKRGTFTVVQSEVSLTVSKKSGSTNISKVYDRTTNIPEDTVLSDKIAVTFTSANEGATSPKYEVTSVHYTSYDVNTNINISYVITITSAAENSNYSFVDEDYSSGSFTRTVANGTITRRPLSITVNLNASGNISKVYDDTNYLGGITETRNGASNNGSYQAISAINRSGNGFTVTRVNNNDQTGIVASEVAGTVLVKAVIKEIGEGRTPTFDKYINNVEEHDGVYSIAGTHYKQVIFTLSGTRASNYTLIVTNNQPSINLTGATVSTDGTTITYTDSNATSTTVPHIYITKYTVNANYHNNYQSYAKTKNVYTYETEDGWEEVTGLLPNNSNISDDLEVVVVNNWRTENGAGQYNWNPIVSHKVIKGQLNTSFYAYLDDSKDNGIDINYVLKNQPVLTIDYFVPKDNTVHEITTLAGLLMATYYYRNYSTTQIVWIPESNQLEYDEYISTHPNAERVQNPDDNNNWGVWAEISLNPVTYSYTFLEEGSTAYSTYIASNPDEQIVYNDATHSYGVWVIAAEANKIISFNKFRLGADISGIMTAKDYLVLKNAFMGQGGTAAWGYGYTYITNFMQTNIGEEVIVLGNFFADIFDDGTFDGNGYVIKNFAQIYNVTVETQSTVNIGFIGKATDRAEIKDIALREYKLYVYDYTNLANTLNIGALIGLSEMSTSLSNTTVHASVNISATNAIINSGIIMGKYAGTITDASISGATEYAVQLAIENAIALGNMTIDNATGSANVGGILGSIGAYTSTNGNAIYNAVVFADILVSAATPVVGGIIGYAGDPEVQCIQYLNSYGSYAYLSNSTAYRTSSSGTWTIDNKAIGNVVNGDSNLINLFYGGTTYSKLMSLSTSAYDANRYYIPESTTLEGMDTFDIISEFKENETNHSYSTTHKYESYQTSGESSEPRESTRLKDLIRVYVLKYELSVAATTSNEHNVRVYKIATSNTMLGDFVIVEEIESEEVSYVIGTSDYKIKLSYAQHVTMLRMFRFAEFELKKQINLPVSSYNIVYSGIFYGNITASDVTVIAKTGYTARKIGSKTYETLAKYVEAYNKYYHVTLRESGNNYVYTPKIYVYNNTIKAVSSTETIDSDHKKSVGGVEYSSLSDYITAYETYYNVTLTLDNGYYVYTQRMFDREINQVPIDWVRSE